MSEKSTILKLRQAESRDVTTNGSYSISLKEGVTLEEGDIVKVHSVFLDTTTESLVEITEPTLITMDVAKYWQMSFTRIAAPNTRILTNPTFAAGPPVVGVGQPDNNRYWVCAEYPRSAAEYIIASVHIKPAKHGKKYGNFILTYDYPAVGTRLRTKGQKKIGQYHTRSHASGVTIPITIMMDAGALPPTGQVVCTNTNLGASAINVHSIADTDWTFTGPHAGGDTISDLYTEELNFTLPTGRYQPSEIGKIISDKMSQLDILGPVGNDFTAVPPEFLVNNPFLSSARQQMYKIGEIPILAGTPSLVMMPEITSDYPTVKNIITFLEPATSATDYWIGANQTSLNYDSTLKKLNFDILHFPRYVDEGGAGTSYLPGVEWTNGNVAEAGAEKGRVRPIGSAGGCAFTRLEPLWFWETLGFSDLLLDWTHITTPLDLDAAEQIIPLNIVSTDGVNTTNAFFGTDLVVSKTATWPFGPGIGTGSKPPPMATTATQPIISDREFDNVINDEGYLLVEIGVNIPQQMIGGNTEGATGSNKVQSIVGRYYQQEGNFLQDNGAGSVVYEHVGVPQMITDLDIRVVHPDGAPPEENELGVSNSVFLEIIKTTQPTQKQ